MGAIARRRTTRIELTENSSLDVMLLARPRRTTAPEAEVEDSKADGRLCQRLRFSRHAPPFARPSRW